MIINIQCVYIKIINHTIKEQFIFFKSWDHSGSKSFSISSSRMSSVRFLPEVCGLMSLFPTADAVSEIKHKIKIKLIWENPILLLPTIVFGSRRVVAACRGTHANSRWRFGEAGYAGCRPTPRGAKALPWPWKSVRIDCTVYLYQSKAKNHQQLCCKFNFCNLKMWMREDFLLFFINIFKLIN